MPDFTPNVHLAVHTAPTIVCLLALRNTRERIFKWLERYGTDTHHERIDGQTEKNIWPSTPVAAVAGRSLSNNILDRQKKRKNCQSRHTHCPDRSVPAWHRYHPPSRRATPAGWPCHGWQRRSYAGRDRRHRRCRAAQRECSAWQCGPCYQPTTW